MEKNSFFYFIIPPCQSKVKEVSSVAIKTTMIATANVMSMLRLLIMMRNMMQQKSDNSVGHYLTPLSILRHCRTIIFLLLFFYSLTLMPPTRRSPFPVLLFFCPLTPPPYIQLLSLLSFSPSPYHRTIILTLFLCFCHVLCYQPSITPDDPPI